MKARIWTVANLNRYISGLIEDDPAFQPQVVVEGDVSLGPKGYSRYDHIYFTLIDPDDPSPDYRKAKLSCAMWKSTVARGGLTYDMKNGDNIRVTGRLEVYGPRSQFQLIATKIENAGLGRLEAAKKALEEELRKKGYFAPEHKKPIPKYITKVGVVTSPTGEAIHDIIRNIQIRNPHVQILLVPALVQGENAPESIAQALEIIDGLGMDVIICGRGGGSPEDLMAFSSREVADAIYNCNTPVISAVGHEPDMSISDYVADLRVATPTAAAMQIFEYHKFEEDLAKRQSDLLEMLSHRLMEAELRLRRAKEQIDKGSPRMWIVRTGKQLENISNDLRHIFTEKLSSEQNRVSKYLPYLESSMKAKTDAASHRVEMSAKQLPVSMERKIADRENSLKLAAQKLEYSSPLKKISDGFAYVEGEHGRITSVTQVRTDDTMQVRLKDGIIDSTVTGVKEEQLGSNR